MASPNQFTAQSGQFFPPSFTLPLCASHHQVCNRLVRQTAKTHTSSSSFLHFSNLGMIDRTSVKYLRRNNLNPSRRGWRMRPEVSAEATVQQEDLVGRICKTNNLEHWEDTEEFMKSIAKDLKPDVVLEVLNQQTDAQKALRFFQWMEKQNGYEHHTDAYSTVIEILGKAKMFSEIQALLQQMRSSGCEISVTILNSLIQLYGLDSTKGALEVFDFIKIEGHMPPVSSYNAILSVLVNNTKFSMAENMFTEMRGNGVRPNKDTYTHMIQCMCRKGNLDGAIGLLNDMNQNGCTVDVVNYTFVISRLCRRGRMEQASEIFDIMQKNGCEPNIVTYNSMIIGLCFVGRVEEALEWLSMIKSKGCKPNIYTYTLLLDNFCKVGRLDEAKDIFNEALMSGIKLNVVIYNALINGYCKGGKFDEALLLLEEMPQNDCMPDIITYTTIIYGLIKGNRILEALKLHDQMADKGYELYMKTMTTLFRVLCRDVYTKDAIRLFRKMQKRGHRHNALDYYLLIHAHTAAGEIDMAYTLFHEMLSKGLSPILMTYNTIIRGFCREERLSEATKMLDIMIENGMDPNTMSYNILIKEYHKLGMTEGAKQLYSAAIKRGVIPSKKLELCLEVTLQTPESYYNAKANIKLYVRRVFISDEFEELLPKYLGFLMGIVDSDTLPLNVSREMLQQHNSLKTIKKKLIRKALDMIRRIAEEDPDESDAKGKTDVESESEPDTEKKGKYVKFWNEFGKSIKLGIIEDASNRNRLAKLLRFESTKSGNKLASLDQYISRMKPGQKDIYYITGSSKEQLEKSPFLERLKKKNYEVIFFTDPVDEYLMQYLMDYEDKKFQNVSKEGLKLGKDTKDKEIKDSFKELTNWWKDVLSSENVDSVKISNRLDNTPGVVVTSKYGWSANMERIMQSQTLSDANRQSYMRGKRVLEINPRHPIIKELRERVTQSPEDENIKQTARLIYQTALMESGFILNDPKEFASSIYSTIKTTLNVNPDAIVEEDDETEEEVEVETKEEVEKVSTKEDGIEGKFAEEETIEDAFEEQSDESVKDEL